MTLAAPAIGKAFKGAAEHTLVRSRRTPPFSLRLTPEEKTRLRQEAGSMPLGTYIRSKLLGEAARPRRHHRSPVKDEQTLARLLAEIGTARLANNLNQLAKAANTGSLPVTSDTEKALREACQDIRWMRETLIAALGLKP
jgi:hypothetical protein